MHLQKRVFDIRRKSTIFLFFLYFLLPINSHANQNSDWKVICENKPLEVSGCQTVSSPSTIGNRTIRLLIYPVQGRMHVVILSSDNLYMDNLYRGSTAITVDDNDEIQFNYVGYAYSKEGETNVLTSAADTPLLSQMENGFKLKIDIQYSDNTQHTHELGLIGFTRAINQL